MIMPIVADVMCRCFLGLVISGILITMGLFGGNREQVAPPYATDHGRRGRLSGCKSLEWRPP